MSNNQFQRRLPARPSLEFLKKQAKRLLRQAKRGEATALVRLQSKAGDAPRLADAQRVLAREYGFLSWRRMLAAIRHQADDRAIQEVRFAARRYAASIGCSSHTVAALGQAEDPGTLVEQLLPLCPRDDALAIEALDAPRARLEHLHRVLQRMLEGHWPLSAVAETQPPIDPTTARAELVVVAEREPAGLLGRRFPLRDTMSTVGRALRNDVCLPSSSVSRTHCTVQGRGDGFAVRDEGSTNGIFVPGDSNRVALALLGHRDRVRVGALTLELHIVSASSPGPRSQVAASRS